MLLTRVITAIVQQMVIGTFTLTATTAESSKLRSTIRLSSFVSSIIYCKESLTHFTYAVLKYSYIC